MSSYKPLGTRVLVKIDDAKDKTEGGIIIPESVKQRPNTGVVKYVGDECTKVKPEDKILFPQECGMELNVDGEDLYLMVEESIDMILG